MDIWTFISQKLAEAKVVLKLLLEKAKNVISKLLNKND